MGHRWLSTGTMVLRLATERSLSLDKTKDGPIPPRPPVETIKGEPLPPKTAEPKFVRGTIEPTQKK